MFYVAPRSSDRKFRNKRIKMTNGNIFQKQLAIFHQNIVGTKNSKDTVAAVELLIAKLVPDILVISEADTEVITSSRYPGYVAHKGQLLGADLVRVSALVRTGIIHQVTYLDVEVPNIVISFKVDNLQYRCTGVYREWNFSGKTSTALEQSDRWSLFEDAWLDNNKRCRHSLMIGDFNFCYYGNGTPHQAALEPLRSSVLDHIVLRGWGQLVKGTTRHQGNQKPSCLDHIYMNFPNQIKYTVNKPYCGSDHNCVGVVIKTKRFIPVGQDIVSRCWDSVNWSWGKYLIKYSGVLYKAFAYIDPNDILDTIEVEVRTVMDIFAPEKLIRIRPGSQRWMTTKVRNVIDRRNALKEKWHKSGSKMDEIRFKDVRTEARMLVRRAKEEQVSADLEVKDLKKRWRKIRSITGGEADTGSPTEILDKGVTYKEDIDIANVLSEGFGEKVEGIMDRVNMDPAEAMILFEEYAQDLEKKKKFGKFEFTEVDCAEVRAACMSLHNTGALGTDGIPTVVIKQFCWELAPYLAYLINQTFRTGIFPDRWRQGIICPIHKGGDKKVKTNYRPVTVTNSLSKVWERIVNNQMTAYFKRHNIIDGSQMAYQANRGTDTYWFELLSKLTEAKDTGKKAVVQLYDLSAAFNLIHLDILRPKLARVGFQTSAINLLSETMTKRLLRTKINGALSEVRECNVGSAEGGICSPQIFNFTLCDIAAIKGRVEKAAKAGILTEAAVMEVKAGTKTIAEVEHDTIKVVDPSVSPGGYADDNGFLSSADTEDEVRALALEVDSAVMRYFSVNAMAANSKKSEALSVLNRFARPIRIGDIESQSQIKLLGIRMTDRMSFLPQAIEVVRKITDKLPSVLRMKEWASRDLLIRTAQSLLMSHISYNLQTYAGETRVLSMLQKCQNKILRSILGYHVTDKVPVATMLAEVGWNSVSNMMRYQSLYWLRRIHKEKVAPYTARLLGTGANITYNTRKRRLELPFIPRTLVTAGAVLHRSVSLYNEFNMFTDLVQMEDFREVMEAKILAKYSNGNH